MVGLDTGGAVQAEVSVVSRIWGVERSAQKPAQLRAQGFRPKPSCEIMANDGTLLEE